MGFIGTVQGPSGRLASQLGEALGMGLGELTGSYFANSAINKIVSDPNLKNASAEERQQALIQRLSPYGARGERMLAKQLELEQKAEDKQLAKLHNKFLSGETLTDQENQMINPQLRLEKRKLDIAEQKSLQPSVGKETTFQKGREKKRAELLNKLEDNYLLAQGRESDYQRLEQLSELTSGLSNPFSQEASEMEALGLSAIEPVLKVFNPTGAIAIGKINMIRDKYAPKWSDWTETKKGKINALRWMNQKAIELGQHVEQLKQVYGDDIPIEELLKLQNVGNQVVSQLEQSTPKDFEQIGSEQSKPLTQEVINQFLQKTNGNPDLAAQMAKEAGYSW